RRVDRHDDGRADAEQPTGEGDGLRVVAGRVGQDARTPGLLVEPREGVVRATKLEGADALEVLGLEEDARAHPLVERARSEDRRAVGDAAQALRGRADRIDGGKIGHLPFREKKSKYVPVSVAMARVYAVAAAAVSWSAVPVASKTMISSSDVRPGLRAVTMSLSSAWMSSRERRPAARACRTSP